MVLDLCVVGHWLAVSSLRAVLNLSCLSKGMAADGALLDLVSRGRKDAFFISPDATRTWFGTEYTRRSPSTREIRTAYPESPARFGGWVDIELPRAGDILMSADIRIRLPTWLPEAVVRMNRTNSVTVESREWPGTYLAYGWTNGIANYTIERWALFTDNVMIVQGYGEFNSWFPDMEATHMHIPIIHASTGTHDGSVRSIQRAAAPPSEYVFRVPLIGCQGHGDVGLPLCALRANRLYLRIWLADKAKLVESGMNGYAINPVTGAMDLPKYEICPTPWGGRKIRINNADTEYKTLEEYEMVQPVIYARYSVLNLEDEARVAMSAIPHSIVFRQQQRVDFDIPSINWNPTARYRRPLEIHGFFQGLYLGIISDARIKQNKYRDINPPGSGEWLIELGLNVNGQDRIQMWPPGQFQELANYTQMRRDVEKQLHYLIFGVNPYRFEPAGTCNLTRTYKVQLNMQLEEVPPDPVTGGNDARASLLGLSWNVFEIRDGLGVLKFAD